MEEAADLRNRNIEISYISALVGLAAVLTSIQLFRKLSHVGKTKAATNAAEKNQFKGLFTTLKAEILYAPVWRFRRAKEATFLDNKINFGQLPPRLHTLIIFGFLGLNIFLITWNLPYSSPASVLIPLLRNRIGSVQVANMIPIVVVSTVKNPLIKSLNISYDNFNLIHRWIARITILEIIAHGLCDIVGDGTNLGWTFLRHSLTIPLVHFGLAAALTFTLVLIQSWKPIRSLAYEVFHYIHIGLIIVAFSFVWLHLREHYQRYYLLVAVVLWALARVSRFVNILYRNSGRGAENCMAFIEQMPADAVKVTLHVTRPWTFRAGQSLYINIPHISFWASHPFSIAWADEQTQLQSDVEVGRRSDSTDKHPPQPRGNHSAMYLIIKRRSGMTNSLFQHIEANKGRMECKAFVEGPYGTTESLNKYESVLLFAGGVGITHQLSFVKQVLKDYALGQTITKRVRLIWVIPTIEAVEWIEPWLNEILTEYAHSSHEVALQLSLFVTRYRGDEIKVQEYTQFSDVTLARPNVAALVNQASEQCQGKTFVSVCAGGPLGDDVRVSVRRLLRKQIDVSFHEEGFGW